MYYALIKSEFYVEVEKRYDEKYLFCDLFVKNKNQDDKDGVWLEIALWHEESQPKQIGKVVTDYYKLVTYQKKGAVLLFCAINTDHEGYRDKDINDLWNPWFDKLKECLGEDRVKDCKGPKCPDQSGGKFKICVIKNL